MDINRRNFSEFGNMQLIDTSDSEEENDGKKAIKLAGTKNGDKGERKGRPLIEVNYVAFCPTGEYDREGTAKCQFEIRPVKKIVEYVTRNVGVS